RKRLRHAAEEMEADQSGRLRIARDKAAGKERLDLRGEAETPAVIGGVERLYAVRVAGEKKRALAFVPDREGEHPAQALEHRAPVAGVEMQKRFRIGRRAEARALGLELGAQLRIIVNLAVEHDVDAAVLARHRLRGALREIEDRKPPMAEPAAAVVRPGDAFGVGTARAHVVARGKKLGEARLAGGGVVRKDTVNAAHW